MSESFDEVCTSYGDCTWIGRDIVKEVIARLQVAHEHEIAEALCDACDQCDRMDKTAHEHEIEQIRKSRFHEGYIAGQHSMDAEHYAVALRLRRLRFDGDSHANLSKLAYSMYPCATGWTCESCDGLRDELIRLLGGVHDDSVPVGEPSDTCGADCHRRDGESGRVTYDVLGNERHKAVCELRSISDLYTTTGDAAQFVCDMANAINAEGCDSETIYKGLRDRLIHLLGGDEPYSNLTRTILEPNLPKSAETAKPESEDGGKITITADLRESLREIAEHMGVPHDMDLTDYSDEAVIDAIYWRIDNYYQINIDELQAQVIECCKQRDKARAEVVNLRDAYYKMQRHLELERDEVERQCDELQKKLASYNSMVMERDKLRKSLRKIAEHVGVQHDLELSTYDDDTVAKATIQLVGMMHKHIKTLEEKLDAIREALDG